MSDIEIILYAVLFFICTAGLCSLFPILVEWGKKDNEE